MRDLLSAWQGFRQEADEYRELDGDRVLVPLHADWLEACPSSRPGRYASPAYQVPNASAKSPSAGISTFR